MLGYNNGSGTPTLANWSTSGSSYNFVYNATNAATGTEGNSGLVALAGGVTASPVGGNFVAQDPDYELGAISQSVSGLTVGSQYTISFYWATAQQSGFSGTITNGWGVTFGTQTDSTGYKTLTNGPTAFSGWFLANLVFTATSTTQTLSFLASETTSGGPPFSLLDGVSITPGVVPEPSTLVLMSIGLVGFVGVGYRRRVKAAKV